MINIIMLKANTWNEFNLNIMALVKGLNGSMKILQKYAFTKIALFLWNHKKYIQLYKMY